MTRTFKFHVGANLWQIEPKPWHIMVNLESNRAVSL
jgi:hypothetical protein